MNRTCMSLNISVVELATKAEANMARVVARAGRICPRNMDADRMVEEINIAEAIGKPKRWDRIDANVCSCHVMGSQ